MAKKAPAPKATKEEPLIPSNLSWRRSIDVSEGDMFSVDRDGNIAPIEVTTIGLRGPTAHSKVALPKPDSTDVVTATDALNPNPQLIDRAVLPPNCDTLQLSFSVAFHPAVLSPDACNGVKFRKKLDDFLHEAKRENLFEELAILYVWNLVNGRVLWRNAYGKSAGVWLSCEGLEAYVPDWKAIGTTRCPQALPEDVRAIIDIVAAALRGDRDPLDPVAAIDVKIRVTTYNGAEVWPSQEYLAKKEEKNSGDVSRTLSARKSVKVDPDGTKTVFRHGTMHSQKIGNAIRTIDTWYDPAGGEAIPVEAFGWVQRDLAIRRNDANSNFYALLRRLEEITADIADYRPEALYVLAMIIRGGVYGVKDEFKAKPGKGGDKKGGQELAGAENAGGEDGE